MLNSRTRDVEALRAEVKQWLFLAMESVPITINDCVMDFIESRARDGISDIASPARLRNITNIADVFRRDAYR